MVEKHNSNEYESGSWQCHKVEAPMGVGTIGVACWTKLHRNGHAKKSAVHREEDARMKGTREIS